MDQLDGLASLYELVTVLPNETVERPAFRLGFNLRGQAEATLMNKEGKELRAPVLLKDPGRVLISEDADMEADSKWGPQRASEEPLKSLKEAFGVIILLSSL